MALRKSKVGGPRLGAGRPPGTGPGPSPDARRHRIAVMLDRHEIRKLKAEAKRRGIPHSTLAYEFVARGLKRLR